MNKRLNSLVAAALMALGLAGAAQAQDEPTVRPLVGMGLTVGGDKFATISLSNGDEEDIKAGQFLQFYAGLRYKAVPNFSVQATIGYHVDDTSAQNAKFKFARYPVEVLGHFNVAENILLGGGIRFANSPKLSVGGDLGSGSISFKNAVGFVVEGEYLVSPQVGLKLRFVGEEYEAKSFPGTVDGSHVGFMANFYF
jgi:hypothetical protein